MLECHLSTHLSLVMSMMKVKTIPYWRYDSKIFLQFQLTHNIFYSNRSRRTKSYGTKNVPVKRFRQQKREPNTRAHSATAGTILSNPFAIHKTGHSDLYKAYQEVQWQTNPISCVIGVAAKAASAPINDVPIYWFARSLWRWYSWSIKSLRANNARIPT